MKLLIVFALLAAALFGQTQQGSTTAWPGSTWDLTSAKTKYGTLPFASLPSAASNTDVVYWVPDCLSTSCAAGGGTVRAWVYSNGSIWQPIAGSGSGAVTIITGTVDPNAGPTACTAAGTGTLTYFIRTDTTPRQSWWCDTANHWRNVLDSTGSGLFSITGVTGSDPSTPASGSATVTINSSTKVLTVTDDAGLKSRTARDITCSSGDFINAFGVTTEGTFRCATPSGGGGGTDPADVTILNNTFYFSNMNYANGAGAFWGLNGSTCVGVFTESGPGISAGMVWDAVTQANTNQFCTYMAPWGGSINNVKFKDFISGGTPLTYQLEVLLARNTGGGAGDLYVGFSKVADTFADFVGIRYNNGAAQYQCIIRSGGSDVTSTAMGSVTPDTNLHWFRVSNGGTANSVTCQVGSVSATTSAGTVPSGDYLAIVGANSVAGSTPRFSPSEARINIHARVAN